ncbi:glycosyltransferase [Maribacter sp. TH_r10]|uniref:glycosyltransferase n=1 Tax=Maribacter sp. TH_r10 TaxID=3082086 RepID=UPI0029535ACF|nr:glycosyltransferase [Maribacter sp. TH_r10]MDV7140114.1 glycosyltransferase [Maribacter sp. TH_r10]
MKILLINNYHYARGGADTVYLNTGKLLKNNGNEVIYFSTTDEQNQKEGQNIFFIAPFNTGLTHLPRFFYSQKAFLNLKSLISKERPDVAHVHIFYGQLTNAVIKALKDNNIPIVMTIHDYRILCPINIMLNNNEKICEKCAGGKYYNSALYKCNKSNFLFSTVSAMESYFRDIFFDYKKNIDHFIMVSEFIKNKHVEYYPSLKEKSSTLYNFKDFEDRKLNTEKNGNLLYFGRLSKEKGIMTLLKALRLLPNITLKIVGTGPMENEIKDFLSKNKMHNIKLLGYCKGDVLWSNIEKSNFSVIPSEWYENNPMTVIESLQLGTPVIGAKIGGIPEIVRSEHGFIFNSGSVEDLKNTIERAFALNIEDYKQMQLNGINFAQTKFAAKSHYSTLMGIYKKTINSYNKN